MLLACVKGRQAKHLQVKTPEMRSLAGSQLEEILDLIHAMGIIAATDADLTVLLGMVNDLMDGMNGVTRNFKAVFNQHGTKRSKQETGRRREWRWRLGVCTGGEIMNFTNQKNRKPMTDKKE